MNAAVHRRLLAEFTVTSLLIALYASMYYAMLRPSEAVSQRQDDCHLPATGWRLIELSET